MAKRPMRLLCLLCACAMLTGCASSSSAPAGGGVTLPPVEAIADAPENDVNQTYAQTVLFYLPALDGTRLIALPEKATLSVSRHSAEALCDRLLAHEGAEATASLGGEVALRLSDTHPVEVSGNVATVSLSASALRLSHEALFTVGQALANTLCQFGDLEYVNVLIAGVQPGLDIAASLPAGCFQPNTREDLATLWARASAPQTAARRAVAAALYYPAPAGKGILCEGRTLSFSELTPSAMIRTLLESLSAGAEYLSGVPACPDLAGLLLEEPGLSETGGERRATLRFDEALNTRLIEAGITRSVMMAALVYTLTTFLPGVDGVEVSIGNELITSLTPSGTMIGAGETIAFPSGMMRRADFTAFLLSPCTLYFANAAGTLTGVQRPVPYYESGSVRALIDQLMQGPQAYDSVTGLSPVLPDGLRDADLIGVSFREDTLLLNFSPQLIALCQGMDSAQERRMVYAMVNTLCQLRGVKRVSFCILGQQPDTFAGALFLPGSFLPNLDLIQ